LKTITFFCGTQKEKLIIGPNCLFHTVKVNAGHNGQVRFIEKCKFQHFSHTKLSAIFGDLFLRWVYDVIRLNIVTIKPSFAHKKKMVVFKTCGELFF